MDSKVVTMPCACFVRLYVYWFMCGWVGKLPIKRLINYAILSHHLFDACPDLRWWRQRSFSCLAWDEEAEEGN